MHIKIVCKYNHFLPFHTYKDVTILLQRLKKCWVLGQIGKDDGEKK